MYLRILKILGISWKSGKRTYFSRSSITEMWHNLWRYKNAAPAPAHQIQKVQRFLAIDEFYINTFFFQKYFKTLANIKFLLLRNFFFLDFFFFFYNLHTIFFVYIMGFYQQNAQDVYSHSRNSCLNDSYNLFVI